MFVQCIHVQTTDNACRKATVDAVFVLHRIMEMIVEKVRITNGKWTPLILRLMQFIGLIHAIMSTVATGNAAKVFVNVNQVTREHGVIFHVSVESNPRAKLDFQRFSSSGSLRWSVVQLRYML